MRQIQPPQPIGTAAGTAAAGDDERFPTADERAALAGSGGSPSGSNKFVTQTGLSSELAAKVDASDLGSAAYEDSSAFDPAGAAAAAQAASQPLNSDLTAIAGLTSAADRLPYATGSHTWALAVITSAARTFLAAVDAAAQHTALALGDAATKNTGTTAGTVAPGDDGRFPTDDEKAALEGTSGAPSTSNKFVTDSDARNTNARAPTGHASSHQHGGGDEVGTATPAANAIPKADSGGKLDSWISSATTSTAGLVVLSDDGGTTSGEVVQANDSRLPIAGYIRDLALFGDGADGVVSISSGTTTITRPMFYSTLTISGTGAIAAQAYPIVCSVECDLSNAPAGAITYAAANGGNGAATTTGGSASTNTSNHLPVGSSSTTGGAGGTAAGSQPSNQTPAAGALCGGIAGGGAGGNGSGGSGGAARTNTAPPSTQWQPKVLRGPLDPWLRIAAQVACGGQGQAGSGGGGDGTAGGGGGAGGQGGQCVSGWFKSLRRSGSTAAGAIRATGGNGGNGGTPAAGNRGGGGGGGAGSGGVVYLVVGGLAGSSATNMLQAQGGTGGTGGTGSGTGTSGNGGAGGYGGLVELINLGTGTISVSDARATSGNAASGTTGGTGATAQLTV